MLVKGWFRFPRNIVCDITPLIEDDDNLSVQSYQTGLTGHMDLKSEGSSLSASLTSLATSGVESFDSLGKTIEPTVKDKWSNWKIKPPTLPSGAGHKWAVWSTSPNNSQGAPHEGTQRSSDDARTLTESAKGSSDNSSLFGWTLLPQTVPYAPFRTYTSGSSATSRRSSLFGWTIMPQVAPKMPLGIEEQEGWFAWPVRQHETDTSSSRNPSDENVGTSSDRVEVIDSYPQSSTSDDFVPIGPPMRDSDTSESWSDALLDDKSDSDTLTANSAENKDGGSDQDHEEPSKTSPPTSLMSDGFIPLVQSSSSSTDFLTGTDVGSASEESGTPPRSDTHSDDTVGSSTTSGFTPLAPLQDEESKYEESGIHAPSDTRSDDTVGNSATSGFAPIAPLKDEESGIRAPSDTRSDDTAGSSRTSGFTPLAPSKEKESDESGMPVLSDDRSDDSVSRTESDLLTSIMEDVAAVRTELRDVMSSDSDGSRKITREKFTRL
ncbi:Hypp8018 [Branchiostoma lanceolatum]|uniref:Hypp8018 protein n=1 Tax=Branchiostoma lanceolatum TaxID=7740 RepID=A0A8K0EEE2_BRALA|nr:Hypp8018 [Branchiostoma lanceolatum]